MGDIDLVLFRKMIACLPFADADSGIVETQDAMHNAADDISSLRARVAELEETVKFNEDQRRMLFDSACKLEADRDRWKAEAMAARPFISMGRIEAWQPDEFHPGIKSHIAYKNARAATDAIEKEPQ